jgi:hypothetical protein
MKEISTPATDVFRWTAVCFVVHVFKSNRAC